MPMSPRLLRPILSGDPDALRYIAAVQQADQQSLEPAVRKAITDFVVGCKADGIWDAIKASCILMGARTLSGALTPLKGGAPTNVNNNFVSGDYDRKTGLVGDKTTKSLNTNRNNADDPQDNHHLSVYVHTAATSAGAEFPVYIGAGGADNGSSHFGRLQGNGALFVRGRNSTADTLSGGGGSVGLIAISRSQSAEYSVRRNGSTETVVRASQSSFSGGVTVFRVVASNTLSNARLTFYSVGESLDLALLDTRVTALYNAIGAAI
jgi:hypothetical protein